MGSDLSKVRGPRSSRGVNGVLEFTMAPESRGDMGATFANHEHFKRKVFPPENGGKYFLTM